MVMAHKYVNVAVTPKMSPAKPPSIHNGELVTNKENTNSPPVPTVVEPLKTRTSSQSSYRNVDITGNRSLVQPQTPASPLPPRLSFSRVDSPGSPTPPLPARNYSWSGSEVSDLNRHSSISSNEEKAVIEHTTSTQGCEYAVVNKGTNNASQPPSASSHAHEYAVVEIGPNCGEKMNVSSPPPVSSSQGHEYAELDQSPQSGERITVLQAPPVPLRANERLAQDAVEAGYSEIAVHSSRKSRDYTEIDIPRNDETPATERPLAYAVVELHKEVKPLVFSDQPRRQGLSGQPRPYEVHVPSPPPEGRPEPGYDEVSLTTSQLSSELLCIWCFYI